MPQEIPLTSGASNAHQTFSVQLGDNFLDFRMDYKSSTGQWSINISQDGTMLAAGVMPEPNANIIEGYNLEDTIGQIKCVSPNNVNATLDNLGTEVQLLWYSPDE